jgi:hypothetical protein
MAQRFYSTHPPHFAIGRLAKSRLTALFADIVSVSGGQECGFARLP